MILKNYQKRVLDDLSGYLAALEKTKNLKEAFRQHWAERGVAIGFHGMQPYNNLLAGVPHVCLKVPTGGGKTLLGCASLRRIFDSMGITKTKAVVWLVPSTSILDQTARALSSVEHPYRQWLDYDFGSRVEIYNSEQAKNGQNLTPSTVLEQLSVFVMSYDSLRIKKKEGRKAYQENGALAQFVPHFTQPDALLPDVDESALIQVLGQMNPVVVVDESHNATSELSVEMLKNLNPSFVLDLTATPRQNSNIISIVDAREMKRENMVKLPVIVYNRHTKQDVLTDAIQLRGSIERQAKAAEANGGQYIRPIVLFQAQPKGKESSATFEKLKAALIDMGIPKEEIAIKTSEVNELKNVELMSRTCPIRYIITVNALKEGWDCPFAYILATLANRTSQVDVEQIVGRILRLPYTEKHGQPLLNMSYVLTCSNDFSATVQNVIKGLNRAGFSDKEFRVGSEAEPEQEKPEETPAQQSMDPCFNLIDEKWLRLMKTDGAVEELTLPQALFRAHEYRALAGETPTQDVALLRFLLAVLYAALFADTPPETPAEALEVWHALWRQGRFPAEPIQAYLNRWRDRFWLFHPERPFFQVPSGIDGIDMENAAERAGLDKPGKPAAKGVQRAAKLNGAISESGNKDNLFNVATGEAKHSLSFPEAARWLIHVMGYDDGGIKPYYPKNSPMNRTDDVAKCSKAWLGSISPVYAEGDTLFETLMLNLVLLRNGEFSEEALWPDPHPAWESDALRNVEMQGVQPPDDPARLCAFPSRRIMLIRREDRVIGFIRYVGEAFSRDAAQAEQWTLWTIPKAKKGEVPRPVPRSARLPAQIWREMGALLMVHGDGSACLPGVVRWVSCLSAPKHAPFHNKLCRFHCVKALYDVAQSSNMTEIQDDSLTFSVDLLTDSGKDWMKMLEEELDRCDRAAWQLGLLAEQLMGAEGGKVYEGGKKRTAAAEARRNEAQERFYFELDLPFRAWLQTLRAEDDSELRHARTDALRKLVRETALRCGREMLDRVSPAAYARRKKGEGEEHITAPKAWLIFRRTINKLTIQENDREKEAKGA